MLFGFNPVVVVPFCLTFLLSHSTVQSMSSSSVRLSRSVLGRCPAVVAHRRLALGWVRPPLPSTAASSSMSSKLYSTTTTTLQHTTANQKLSFETTPLGANGMDLLNGLDVFTVPALDDDHPLAVYGIESTEPVQYSTENPVYPILLLHGRTWSSVPVYHLLGGNNHNTNEASRSTMEELLAKGLQPYAMDFRGFGGTHHDSTGFVEPMRCVGDTETVLKWIAKRHGLPAEAGGKPTLLGWSQGALVAQLAAQKSSPALSKVILYGSIYDRLARYPREPLYIRNKPNQTIIENNFDDAIEDFTVEGTIPPEPARRFAEAALISDPIKAQWGHTYQFNNCDPARVHLPTLVIAGDQDPYAPLHVQEDLFVNIGRGADRTWCILSDSDHAAHLLENRHRLINTVVSFVRSTEG